MLNNTKFKIYSLPSFTTLTHLKDLRLILQELIF